MTDRTAGIFSAQLFRQAIDRSGLTSRAVADRLNVTANTVSNLSTGKSSPSVELLGRIAATLNSDVTDFLNLPPQNRWHLRHYRLAAGLTQAEVADHVGVVPAAVSAWETNRSRPPKHAITALAALFDVSDRDIQHAITVATYERTDCVLTMAETVRTMSHLTVRATLNEPHARRSDKVLSEIRSRIIETLEILDATMADLDKTNQGRAKRIVKDLAATLKEASPGQQ